MNNTSQSDFNSKIISIAGRKNILLDKNKTLFYSTGIRVGGGVVAMVVFPNDLFQLWQVLEECIRHEKIIIMQAANTGLTGGSTPDGNNYDREIVIINCLHIKQLILINSASQVIALPGTTLYDLEEKLLPFRRGPHSVIGSSCIGASVIGGVCNNSGGNLVNRGPAYTELSLYARLNELGKLELVNHLGINLGKSPRSIFTNLQAINFNIQNVPDTESLASDKEYQFRVRDINASSPARFNSDSRRLFESSGCAGKIAVFAVRLDTFPLPEREKVFFVGTNNAEHLTHLREKILTNMNSLPDMGEYMHFSYFDGSAKYCKDTFLFLKYFGTKYLPKLLEAKRYIDQLTGQVTFLPENISDRLMQFIADILPNHLPIRLLSFRKKFNYYMLLLASNNSIEEMKLLLDIETEKSEDFEYIECTESEGKDALLHRYVAGAAPARYKILNPDLAGDLLPLDIAFPRNFKDWDQLLPQDILNEMSDSFEMAHFLCMVFHLDFVVKKGVDSKLLKEKILKFLDSINAKYPAEHNVGHLYKAEKSLEVFYRELDPTNTFNSGIGKMSKRKNYQ
ncbi:MULTISPECIES: D-lactate dehydrogenase [Prochlorococcus]|uniref:Quinone-dependent D-lactate dehydrogenase n=1 Tax=Prochlorococcus marinus (strain SARG / CCMP1375 / SS120) TaxID=167539 RepID=Q7V9S2_PROMA|nr:MULTISPECIES: D-lactate dehydrogenase [Prochlorococcus]AAQ00799.1 D-lactate dehydrogenase, NADH independent [Prochlorococcus marinus subsp. marinus str. CCMP1375]KGG10707.1 D-Lactate dehydrogenase [Prochlorococcus marinus str. LG]KGG21128.1 D-Lactate dehydrogenase [Prochlorococcus marinus str. SS2]KGG23952.1 D-Lactate dehydrogenase [Prochlorococcus marinus str. SS35]KGG34854.1 D-Lactate dehydrogenase [Prochlorococcus sp. SS52]